MTSYIVASTDKRKRDSYISDFCEELSVDKFDITRTEFESSKNLNSIGINDIKSIHQKIFLKPLNSESKVIIIDEAHLLTIEAQNALLKLLEEPPEHTIIILSAENKDVFLPTILSRCHVIELETEMVFPSDEEIPQLSDFLKRLPRMTIGERLKNAEVFGTDSEEALVWISKLVMVSRRDLLQEKSNIYLVKIIKKFQNLYTLIKTTNVNPRFAIENTLLSI